MPSNAPIQNKVVTIKKVFDNGDNIRFTDQDGEKYSFFKNGRSGPNQQWEQWQNMELTEGEAVSIGYVINGQYKNIMSFQETMGREPAAPIQKPRAATLEEDPFSTRLAVHGFVNALLNQGKTPSDITDATINSLIGLEKRINYRLDLGYDPNVSDIPF